MDLIIIAWLDISTYAVGLRAGFLSGLEFLNFLFCKTICKDILTEFRFVLVFFFFLGKKEKAIWIYGTEHNIPGY